MTRLKTFLPKRMRNRHLLLLDAASLVVAPIVAFAVRFEDLGWVGDNLRMVLPYIFLPALSASPFFTALGCIGGFGARPASVS